MGACQFSTYGHACGAETGHGKIYCNKHIIEKCSGCGVPATHGCDYCGQFVCGAPLCEKCEGWNDTTKPSGSWGFLNHAHRMKSPFREEKEKADKQTALIEAFKWAFPFAKNHSLDQDATDAAQAVYDEIQR